MTVSSELLRRFEDTITQGRRSDGGPVFRVGERWRRCRPWWTGSAEYDRWPSLRSGAASALVVILENPDTKFADGAAGGIRTSPRRRYPGEDRRPQPFRHRHHDTCGAAASLKSCNRWPAPSIAAMIPWISVK
jgi:hypothetical protein